MSYAISALSAVADWRSLAVLRRNALVYFRNWRTAFLPPAMEPVIAFLSLGLGLAGYVGTLAYQGGEISYPTYLSAGLIAFTGFSTPFYEALYSSYVRMFYQKTWDGILATQVELSHIIWGEVLWAGARGMMNAAVVCLVMAVFDAIGVIEIRTEYLPLMPLFTMASGVAFGSFALIFTALVPSIDHMNYPVFLIGVPLSMVSNTYFPVNPEHPALAAVMMLNPVGHLAELIRGLLVSGTIEGTRVLAWLLSTTTLLVVTMMFVQRRMRRRVLGE